MADASAIFADAEATGLLNSATIYVDNNDSAEDDDGDAEEEGSTIFVNVRIVQKTQKFDDEVLAPLVEKHTDKAIGKVAVPVKSKFVKGLIKRRVVQEAAARTTEHEVAHMMGGQMPKMMTSMLENQGIKAACSLAFECCEYFVVKAKIEHVDLDFLINKFMGNTWKGTFAWCGLRIMQTGRACGIDVDASLNRRACKTITQEAIPKTEVLLKEECLKKGLIADVTCAPPTNQEDTFTMWMDKLYPDQMATHSSKW